MNTATEVDTFDTLAAQMRAGFTKALAWGGNRLYQTNAKSTTFDAFLTGFPGEQDRQYHNCACCRSFLKNYGGLVVINDKGERRSAMFGFLDFLGVPKDYFSAAKNAHMNVAAADITTVFSTSESIWGVASSGGFRHFAVAPPAAVLHTHRTKSPGQLRAYRKEEFGMLTRGLREFSAATLQQALAVMQGDAVLRAGKFVPQLQGLIELHDAAKYKPEVRTNLLWHAVATKPEGFCHITSSALGTFLTDLEKGVHLDKVKARFNSMMNPLTYQRPTTAPAVGNIQRAEKIVADLGLAPAFPRRYVTLDDPAVQAQAWLPTAKPSQKIAPAAPPPTGVFASLMTPTELAKATGRGTTMTWERFRDKVAPTAVAIEVITPKSGSFGAITTAQDPTAPPLFAWDKPEARNPYSWYRWTEIDAADFGLTQGQPTNVLAAVHVPSLWYGYKLHNGVVLVLDGARDRKAAVAGTGLFTELITPDLREVRSTIAAHTARDVLADPGGQLAAGLVLREGVAINLTLRVHTAHTAMDYFIDRWN